jgi:hypothetical protein
MVWICLQLAIDILPKTTLLFVATSDADSTTPGKPSEMKYTDNHGNVCVRLV